MSICYVYYFTSDSGPFLTVLSVNYKRFPVLLNFQCIFHYLFFFVLTDERESVQKKTFQKWVNSHLVRVGCRIGDLYVDMRDGKQLIKLLEVLSGERLVCKYIFKCKI